jgi:lysine 2,3-aminomutase
VVVSGGDVSNLRAEYIEQIGTRLLSIGHVRRIRFATKGPAVIPQKLVTDEDWVGALTRVVAQGKRLHKQVALHTHFNHPNEITAITKVGLDLLMEQGVTVRNQTVLQRGVNDDAATMQLLVRRLSFLNVQPYYVFVHDLVPGVEDLRTSLRSALDLERQVRGLTAGFNTPVFVVDTPGGGGKRDAHSFAHYDRDYGISIFTSPTVKPGVRFLYFDPLHSLEPEAQERWQNPAGRAELLAAARALPLPD